MALAKITLIGLNNYTDGSIWDEFTMPDGIDADVAKNTIMQQCGEFPIIYPNPDYLKSFIGLWCNKWAHNFERWYKAETMEYEALYNLDVKSTITDNGSRSSNTSANTSTSGDTVNQVSAYDSSDFQNASKITNGGSSEGTTSGTENSSNTHVEIRQGNQGSSFSQDMLAKEYDIRRWNLYNHIADVFAAEMCISIYE